MLAFSLPFSSNAPEQYVGVDHISDCLQAHCSGVVKDKACWAFNSGKIKMCILLEKKCNFRDLRLEIIYAYPVECAVVE
jgi:hypothetical protein